MSQIEVQMFGPMRGIGMAMPAMPGAADFAGLWIKRLVPRKAEIRQPERGISFAVCRCIPGVKDGTFEYMAMFQATEEAPVPEGMVAIDIPSSRYLVVPVASYAELGAAWGALPTTLASRPDLTPRCGPAGCQCATYPPFELYPWDPDHKGNAFLYIPVC